MYLSRQLKCLFIHFHTCNSIRDSKIRMADSPQLPRSIVTTERQRNAMDAFPSLKYRSSHKLSHDFVEENSDKRKSLPSTFHQVYPNRDSSHVSESSYGYEYHPAPLPPESGSHYEVLQNPIY